MPSNQAAWIEKLDAKPFVVKDAPYTAPQEGQIVIKNQALAINPADHKLQGNGSFFPFIQYPTIFGFDVAGIVEEVGPGVTSFKKGDRVMAACGVLAPGSSTSHVNGGFQLYTVTSELVAGHIPSHMPFEQGAVVPICWFTAAGALFNSNHLALSSPTLSPQPQNKTVLVWGGSSSVGSNALQLLSSAGYDVLATASAKNHAYVQSLGATAAVDHSSPNVKEEILAALKGKTLAGVIDCIGSGTLETCIQIALEHPDGNKKVVSVIPGDDRFSRDGVEVTAVYATADAKTSVAGQAWREFMPEALRTKVFLAKPDPEIVGNGLGDVQKAVDLAAAGVSAKKIIVSL